MPLSKEEMKERKRQDRLVVKPMSNLKEYPSLIKALVDPEKRKKLEKIYGALEHRGLAEKVDYGVSGVSFDIIGEMLEVTE